MNQKRGQITIFIILGLIILITILLFIYYKISIAKFQAKNSVRNTINSQSFAQPVNIYFLSCLNSVDFSEIDLPPVTGKNYPIDQKIAREIALKSRICLYGLNRFKEQGINVRYGKLKYRIISADPLSIEFTFPVEVIQDGSIAKFDRGYQTYPIRISPIITLLNRIDEDSKANNGNIPLTNLEYDDVRITSVVSQTSLSGNTAQNIITYNFYDAKTGKSIKIPVMHNQYIR